MTEFRESKSGLMIPASVAGRPPCGKCFICGFEAYRNGEMERHIPRCAEDNAEKLAEMSPRRGPQDPANWDVEYERWARGGYRRWDNWYGEHRIERQD